MEFPELQAPFTPICMKRGGDREIFRSDAHDRSHLAAGLLLRRATGREAMSPGFSRPIARWRSWSGASGELHFKRFVRPLSPGAGERWL